MRSSEWQNPKFLRKRKRDSKSTFYSVQNDGRGFIWKSGELFPLSVIKWNLGF